MSPFWFIVVGLAAFASYMANRDVISPCYTCHYSNIECQCQLDTLGCSVICAVGDIGKSTQQKNGCPNRFEGLILDSFSIGC